jgi:hypothetical protein
VEVFVDGKQFLRRALLIGLISALPAVVNGAPPAGGGHSSGGGGGHSGGGGGHFSGGGGGRPAFAGGGRAVFAGGGRPAFAGGGPAVIGNRSPAGMQANASTGRGVPVPVNNSRNFGNDPSGRGDWKHANGTAWHRHDNDDDNGEHEHHHHHRFSFGFFPYWYPSWGYYDYGYPYYSYGYPDYYYPDNGYYYPDNGYYSGQNGSANIQVLVQEALARRGYYSGQVDGVIGPETRSAIREFQRDNGLSVTGRIDSELMRALMSISVKT